jgi:hypothetical protein
MLRQGRTAMAVDIASYWSVSLVRRTGLSERQVQPILTVDSKIRTHAVEDERGGRVTKLIEMMSWKPIEDVQCMSYRPEGIFDRKRDILSICFTLTVCRHQG